MKSKVLLIDDSVTIHRVIDLSIDFDRYDIVKVFSKEDAALKLQSEQFDYILLDNKLDNIIISEYISELKQQQKSAAIILLVGAFDRFDETDLEKTKADDYLVKPFDSQSLNEKLSSEADMMPAGIVERIAEADFARDNDDFMQQNDAEAQDSSEVITKEEYLENLEEVALDDLTDKGYVEDLDQSASSAVAANNNEAEQPLVLDGAPDVVPNIEQVNEAAMESPATDDSTLTAVNNMVSLDDLEEDEDNEDDGSHIADDDMPLSSIDLEEPLNVSKSNDLLEEQNNGEELALPVINSEDEKAAEEQINLDFATDEGSPAVETPVNMGEETEPAIDLPAADVLDESGNDNIEIPDPMTAVRSPILPDIDDAAAIPDEYLMQENLTTANHNDEDMLHNFPDFPDVEDSAADEIQNAAEDEPVVEENTEVVNMDFSLTDEENTPADDITEPLEESKSESPVDLSDGLTDEANIENDNEDVTSVTVDEQPLEEKPLFEDDDWLSDAPVKADDISADTLDDMLPVTSDEVESENAVETPDLEFASPENEEQDSQIDLDMLEEESVEDVAVSIPDIALDEEETAQEESQPLNFEFGETEESRSEEVDPESIGAGASIDTMSFFPEEDNEEAKEEISIPDTDMGEVNQDTAEETPAADSISIESEDTMPVAPVMNMIEETTPVKEAQEYKEDTAGGRFGGITVTISRDEIMSMLGNAIDKYFLEEAVKEVIAANMKDIVRNIVPAIAEKYIKEEIERLKNDE